MRRTLYICYFGVREPLVQTQVLPYLREILRGDGESGRRGEGALEVSLLTFEPDRQGKDLAEFVEIKKRLAGEGIEWDWLPYHKRPSAIATAWDIFRGAFFTWRRIGRYDVLHGRVHVPTLMGALARKFSRRRPKLLFDIRGFFPEEYTDAGVWPEGGLLYRGAKRIERWLMKEADGFVVLTEKARHILFAAEGPAEAGTPNTKPVEVIPCCVDLELRFSGDREEMRSAVRRELNIEGRYVVIHVGALGGLYLAKEIADLLAVARDRNPAAYGLFLTQSDRSHIEPLLLERGFGPEDYFIGRVQPAEIEGYLYASDVGLSIVKATFATQSRSPTKIPEYLACGLPIIANSGVGDVDKLILENCVGALITHFTHKGYTDALKHVEKLVGVADHCRDVARREFDLESTGGARYRRIYHKLFETD